MRFYFTKRDTELSGATSAAALNNNLKPRRSWSTGQAYFSGTGFRAVEQRFSSCSSADTYRSRIPVQGTELEHGIVRTYPRVCAAVFARTTPCTISVCTVWVRARTREERSTPVLVR